MIYTFSQRFVLITLLLLVMVSLTVRTANAQNTRVVDSLQEVLETSKKDTVIIKALIDLAWEYRKTDSVKASSYANDALARAKEVEYRRGEALALYTLGLVNDFAGHYEQALEYYRQSLVLYEQLDDRKRMASNLNNIGAVYSFQGNYDRSIEYYLRSLTIKEEMGDKKGIASTLNNIGTIYEDKKEFEKALGYYLQSLEIKEKLGDKSSISASYTNVGSIYQSLGKRKEAMEYYTKAVNLYEQVGDLNGLALTYNSIGSLYSEQGNMNMALEYNRKAYKMQEQAGDRWGMSFSLFGIGEAYLRGKKYREAVDALQRGIDITSEIGALQEQAEAYALQAEAYEGLGDHKKALDAFRRFYVLKDSISSEASNKAIVEMQTKYETSKKEKEIVRLNKEQELAAKEAQKDRLVRNFLIGLSLLVIALAVVLMRGYVIKKRSNTILGQQRDALDVQKKIIEEKNKEIGDSIEYARYIQEAVLPSFSIQELAPDAFVLYIPRDIVSGDFYWFEKDDEAVYFIAADCTGHGVPGAFMSMIGTILLNEIFNEKMIRRPGEMLTALNMLLKMSLKQHGHSLRTQDGMDIAICRYDINRKLLESASANRPVWVLRNAAQEIETIKADKAAIGGNTSDDHVFATNTVQLEEGDCFYLFSDGYADQFGGPSGKKMMTSRFKDLLISIRSLPMQQQRAEAEKFFTSWKGGQQQVDDVLVMGVRV